MKTTINPIRVSHYAETEGSLWKELLFDYRIPDDLPPLPVLLSSKTLRVAPGISAVALKTVDGRIWDTVNGFNKEIEKEIENG